ncbi:hypothetical protein TNCT_239621 [Trichonephila clavata]|uniref:Uncharacterized protein n=1 Tax=Trichonephila clavata TaxID=2740835 RepID=A0A8X6FMG9_TRICU|nr:hypothetical protein TNCT_239621 [Trichonephila clavata]
MKQFTGIKSSFHWKMSQNNNKKISGDIEITSLPESTFSENALLGVSDKARSSFKNVSRVISEKACRGLDNGRLLREYLLLLSIGH